MKSFVSIQSIVVGNVIPVEYIMLFGAYRNNLYTPAQIVPPSTIFKGEFVLMCNNIFLKIL